MTQHHEPELVEAADRAAAADLLDEISDLLEHNGIGQVADLIRDGEFDEHCATTAFARHRRAAQSAQPVVTEAMIEALAGYRAAVSFIYADSWDGCSDCMEILKAARAADWDNEQAADLNETAKQLARIRAHRPALEAPAQPVVTERREPPQLLSSEESKALLERAEHLWADLQANNLGGFSGINRPFYILNEFRRVVEQFGGRDTGLHWSKDQLAALASPAPAGMGEEQPTSGDCLICDKRVDEPSLFCSAIHATPPATEGAKG